MHKERLVWGKFIVRDGSFPGSCTEKPRKVTWRELTIPMCTGQRAESQGPNGSFCSEMSRKLAHSPQPVPTWSKVSPSPLTLQIAEDVTAQALGTERLEEKSKECWN